MRHAAPASHQPLNRAARLTLAALTYTAAFAVTATITIVSALAIWSLWQWMGVN